MKKIYKWLAAALILTVIFGTIYAASQQVLRMDANDPQIQLAEDAAARLDRGDAPEQVVISDTVNAERSLAPFVTVYDRSGQPVAGSGMLNGSNPRFPRGVLKHAENKPYYAITWQPSSDLRFASVSVAAKNYYVVAARSLKEVESRENTVGLLSLVGWAASVVTLGATFYIRSRTQ